MHGFSTNAKLSRKKVKTLDISLSAVNISPKEIIAAMRA
jgi:hypothetical protein